MGEYVELKGELIRTQRQLAAAEGRIKHLQATVRALSLAIQTGMVPKTVQDILDSHRTEF